MRKSSTKGFKKSASLLGQSVRRVSETRGFAVSRVLTHWPEIVGEDLAAVTRPVKVSHNRQSLGATLTVLSSGPHAPLVEMQKDMLRERVNAIYGYNAISRIAVTQTAPQGFADGQADFAHHVTKETRNAPNAAAHQQAQALTRPVGDSGLRAALETLGTHVLSRTDTQTKKAET